MASDADGTRILMLHRVLEDLPAAFGLPGSYRMRGTALTPVEFRRLLDDAGPILPLEAVERALSRGVEPPAGSVLTFDDGYREHLDLVAPLLASRGVSATFYVATGLHAGAEVAIVDAWYWLLDHAGERVAQVPMPDGNVYRGRLDTHEGKAAWVAGDPKAALLASTVEQQAAMVATLSESAGCALPADLSMRLYLRQEEWARLVDLGMRVGAHSVRHPRLTQVGDVELRAEVVGSVEALRRLGHPVAFAYPDGALDHRVVAEVRRAQASSAVTCEVGTVRRDADVMRLPRVFVRSR
jgi:peptidoglycan/xylan/chitin deacetylase (PgdA/CDA1 family)